jgi:ankyrin repeat protein
MKPLLLTTIAAVLLVGCATTQSPEPPTAKAPDISIYEAAREGNIEAVKQHIAAGTDVNAKNDNGEIPLHYAAFVSHKEILELLIAKGADVNAKDKDDETPLDEAIISMLGLPGGHSEIADLLRKHGGKTGEELKAEGK